MRERDLFIEALQKTDPVDRIAYLDAACAGDEVLRGRVLQLLAQHEKNESFLLDAPAPPLHVPLGATIDQPTTESPGTVIGPYKLIEQIGEGGMGTVWMAQQTEPVKRLVAVKLIKAGMDSKQVIARFEAERQALALMDHPNIARVLDGGTTEAGRPYFVMDLVKGQPITKYCDEHHLTPRQRLELFVPVCQAVQHAHQKGIIHRDLKPSNVLVALYDGKPVPKVIDFGVAKAAGQSLTEKTLVTGFGAIVGTLEYMSPEQAEVNQLDIDTRSDIYSLGVLLYELLAGSPPFTRKELEKAGMLEMLRVIREQEPSKPSTKLSSSDALPTLSAKRGTEPAKLTKLVRGELDWIVMKALEKDRNRRYETANSFAMDVQRYLADEAVQACPPSAGYRLRKFSRRNKTALAFGGVILLAIAVLGSGIGWAVRDRAAREAAADKERQDREQQLTARVEQILDDADRLELALKWPEARAAVGRAEAVLAGGEVGDAIRQRVSDARRDLEFIARLDRIRQDRSTAVPGGGFNNVGVTRDYAQAFRDYGVDVETLSTEEAISGLRRKPALLIPLAAALDDWLEARRALDKGLSNSLSLVAIARGLDPDPLRDRLRSLLVRPSSPELQAELRHLAESIDIKTQTPATLLVLAHTLDGAGLSDSALQVWRDARYTYPADFWFNFGLGFALDQRKDDAEAVRYYTAAVSIRPDSAVAHDNLGAALHNQGKLDDAVGEYRKTIELDPNFALVHSNLSIVLRLRGKLDEAVAASRRAIELAPKEPVFHCNLGNALKDQKKLDEAIGAYRKAIELDPKDVSAHCNLGTVLQDQGKWDEAVAAYRKAIEVGPKLGLPHSNLGNAFLVQGKLDEAIAECRKAIELDPKFAQAHMNLGVALNEQGELDEAVAACRQAIELDPKNPLAHYNLGNPLCKQGKLTEAVTAYRKSIELNPRFALAHMNLGAALGRQQKFDEAAAEFRKAIQLSPSDATPHMNLGVVLWKQGKLDEAIGEYRKAIELDPKDALPHSFLAWLLATCSDLKVRDPQRAVESAKKAVELAPKDCNCWGTLGTAQYRAGNWKAAVQALDKSRELRQGGDSFDWFFLAMTHWQLGSMDEARKWYEKAVEWMDKNAKENDELRRFRREAEELLEIKKK